jgi:signal transduction histidine kinase/ActR/RegA family two-component response regulator
MSDAVRALAAEYASALREYLADGDEADLQRAYDLGHDAMAAGLRILDLAAAHHEALRTALLHAPTADESGRRAQAALAFFMESLSPFEMTHRGFLEANSTLRRLNQTLEQQVQEVQLAHAEAAAAERRSRFLAEAGMRLDAVLEYRARLALVAQLAVPDLADYCILDEVAENGALHRIAVNSADPGQPASARELQRRWPLDPQAPAGAGHVLRIGRSQIWPDPESGSGGAPAHLPTGRRQRILAPDPEHRELLQQLGIRSVMIVPLLARGRTLAVMALLAARSGRHYGTEDLALAEDFARRAAIALDNARLYHEVQDATRRKDEFLAMLAHELRNPLAPILNAAHVLSLRQTDDPILQRMREVVQRQVRHMARLLDDLLDVSRITHGKIELRKERVDLVAIARDALQTSRPFVEASQHEVSISLPPEPLFVEADPARLEQVLTNLLNNAVKYTPSGGQIGITIARVGEEAVVRVRDTGAGISADFLPRVFDLFAQAQRSLDRSEGGLGIGLTLVRRLVEMHGGSVEAYSAGPGQGSEFTVRLPAQPDAQPARAAGSQAAPHAERPRRVLIVEDNLDAAETLADLLEHWGLEVRVACNGTAAIEAAREEPPGVALVDIGLPGMDGYEVVRRLREQAGLDQALLVALTGYGQEEDRRRARQAGFHVHLTKPVDLAELQRLLKIRPEDGKL